LGGVISPSYFKTMNVFLAQGSGILRKVGHGEFATGGNHQ